MKIEVNNLYKEFGKTIALNNVSFSLDAGKIYGFVGPNGAGKTTTMRIMATLDEPSSGDVLIDGESFLQYPELIRMQVGYVPDSLPAHNDITAYEYVDFYARAYGLKGKKREQRVQTIIDYTNLSSIQEKKLKALSKGMKQRVSLARALVHDPKFLLMDEPAAGLDPHARIELKELLKLLSQQGKAILISSHILTELTEICDSALFIEKGNILETGSISQILDKHDETNTYSLKVISDISLAYDRIIKSPHAKNCKQIDDEFLIEVDGDEESAAILKELVNNDVKVVEFRKRQGNLEDIFMRVTKGHVQ